MHVHTHVGDVSHSFIVCVERSPQIFVFSSMFSRFILFLVACIACASAFAPVGGRFLQRSVVSMSKDVAMPDPPAISKSDKDVVGTIAVSILNEFLHFFFTMPSNSLGIPFC